MKISVLASVTPLSLLGEIGSSCVNGREGCGGVMHHRKDNAISGRPTHKVVLLLSTVSETPIRASEPLITLSLLERKKGIFSFSMPKCLVYVCQTS